MKLLVFAILVLATSAFASPTPPSDVVFKPTFLTGYNSLTAGTGFVAHIDGAAVFLTAHTYLAPLRA